MSTLAEVRNTLVGVASAAFFYLLFRGTFSPLFTQMAFGALFGMLAGLLPLATARSRGAKATWTLWMCGAAGGLGGLILAGPLAVGLAIWIWTRGPVRQPEPTL